MSDTPSTPDSKAIPTVVKAVGAAIIAAAAATAAYVIPDAPPPAPTVVVVPGLAPNQGDPLPAASTP